MEEAMAGYETLRMWATKCAEQHRRAGIAAAAAAKQPSGLAVGPSVPVSANGETVALSACMAMRVSTAHQL